MVNVSSVAVVVVTDIVHLLEGQALKLQTKEAVSKKL